MKVAKPIIQMKIEIDKMNLLFVGSKVVVKYEITSGIMKLNRIGTLKRFLN